VVQQAALRQGTTSVVTKKAEKQRALAQCHLLSQKFRKKQQPNSRAPVFATFIAPTFRRVKVENLDFFY
jgi:hypothetical protein